MNIKLLTDTDNHTIKSNIELIEMIIKGNEESIVIYKNTIETLHSNKYNIVSLNRILEYSKKIKEIQNENKQLAGLLDMWQQVKKEKKVR